MRKTLALVLQLTLLLAAPAASFGAVADDQVTSTKIKEADNDGSQNTNSGSGVKTGHIQNQAVTSAKIADGAVTDAKITGPIAANKISSSGLNADTVDGQHADSFASVSHTHGDLDSRIAVLEQALTSLQGANVSLQAEVADLSARLTAAENSPIHQLGTYLSVDAGEVNGLRGPHIIFEGANVHIRSGSGRTDDGGGSLVGLGNLVVGYNEEPAGHAPGERGGSHNLVVGIGHRYSGFNGFVAGALNTISAAYAAVSGGTQNTASQWFAGVSGGEGNIASNWAASVVGGYAGRASGAHSSIVGGSGNQAVGDVSTIAGGAYNRTLNGTSAVFGGFGNTANGPQSVVSGGSYNTANGAYSTVSGGLQRTTADIYDWSAGGLWQDQ